MILEHFWSAATERGERDRNVITHKVSKYVDPRRAILSFEMVRLREVLTPRRGDEPVANTFNKLDADLFYCRERGPNQTSGEKWLAGGKRLEREAVPRIVADLFLADKNFRSAPHADSRQPC